MRTPRSKAPTPRGQAIDWLVEARSGTMTEAQRQALAAWRQADPAHEAAWAHVSGALDHALQPLAEHTSGNPAAADSAIGALLQPPNPRRRRVAGGLLTVAGAGLAGLLAHRITPLPGLLADAHTATAERRAIDLPDGGRLLLDARSAVDIAPASRIVELRQGALIAEAAHPFTVRTRHGEAHLGGSARCMVRVQDDRTQAAALAQPLALRAVSGTQATLAAGQGAWIDTLGSITPTPTPAEDLAAWQRGMLALPGGGTLADVIDALRPYRRGFIRLAPAAARLPVLGAFPLDDTDHTLQALADTLPISVRRYQGGWLVVIDSA
ncbi:MAG: DUF4880 domain-containing protein [Acidovorax sp.]|uniref:FecR family protein n=1 Tax=Acidovorax sp. TaxID=1872122 RepID=UPI0039E2FF11